MELMEMLKALFGGEALTFDQFAEKVNQSADVKLGNLAGGQYVDKTSMMMFQDSLKRQTQALQTMTPSGSQSLSRHRLTVKRSSTTTSLSSRLKRQ